MRNKMTNNTSIFYVIITIISTIGVLFSIGLFIRDAFLETLSVEADAKILSIDYENRNRYATVTYKVGEADYLISTPLDETQEDLTVNDTLKIKYNINNPGIAIYNDHLTEILIIVSISLLGVALTTNKTLRLLRDYKYIKTLKRTGIVLDANITEVYIDVKAPKRKSDFPYRIRAKYLNPHDNKEYTFDSEYTYKNIQELIKNNNIQTIKVYLNKNNTNIYYVDLDSLINRIESNKVQDETYTNKSVNNKELQEENK